VIAYKKIYSSIIDGMDGITFIEKCKNYEKTIVVAKSNFGKILGGYSPMKWRNFHGKPWKTVTGGSSFLFFYENDKLRICTQK